MPHMIVASRLTDGRVVFFTPRGDWDTSIDAGALAEAQQDGERLLAAAKADEAGCRVVEPYLIEVAVEDGRRRPAQVRELIRAFGPSVRTELLEGGAR